MGGHVQQQMPNLFFICSTLFHHSLHFADIRDRRSSIVSCIGVQQQLVASYMEASACCSRSKEGEILEDAMKGLRKRLLTQGTEQGKKMYVAAMKETAKQMLQVCHWSPHISSR